MLWFLEKKQRENHPFKIKNFLQIKKRPETTQQGGGGSIINLPLENSVATTFKFSFF
jgi:hypothetical protein